MNELNGQQINSLAASIVMAIQQKEVSFGDAMAALSIAMVISAKTAGVSREAFIEGVAEDWDIISKDPSQLKH